MVSKVRGHTLDAIGNCHINSEWLWLYSETKVDRSFSSQLKQIKDYPEYIFVASQVSHSKILSKLFKNNFNKILDFNYR